MRSIDWVILDFISSCLALVIAIFFAAIGLIVGKYKAEVPRHKKRRYFATSPMVTIWA